MNLNEKLEEATTNYEEARVELERLRGKYIGPQKDYAETKANLSALQEKIKGCETGLSDLKTKLATELRTSNGETTAEVKKLLRDRRDTDDLLDELRIISQEVENRLEDILKTISPLATAYDGMYFRATVLWGKVNAYRALVDCAPQLRAAMAVIPSKTAKGAVGTSHTEILYEASLPENIILAEIKGWVEAGYDEDEKKPYLADLGDIDLGALKKSEVLTAAQMHFRNVSQEGNVA